MKLAETEPATNPLESSAYSGEAATSVSEQASPVLWCAACERSWASGVPLGASAWDLLGGCFRRQAPSTMHRTGETCPPSWSCWCNREPVPDFTDEELCDLSGYDE